MKAKKCPYCSKRISYISGFSSRRKSEYICTRCGKESKVVINKMIFVGFALAVAVAAGIMLYWIKSGNISNPLGVLLVAIPLVIFMLISPVFLNYVPLKKYKKSMEAKKAGMVYSENIAGDITDEFDFNPMRTSHTITSEPEDTTPKVAIDTSVFNQLKQKRDAERIHLQEEMNREDEEKEADKETDKTVAFVPVISDVSEDHASMDAPLKKIRSDADTGFSRSRHYIPQKEESDDNKKADTNKYTANRKCPHCHTIYGYREVKKIAKEKSHTCYHCKNEFRASKRPCLVLILILFVLAVAANIGVLYMSPNLNFYALVGINVIFILLFIALYPLFVSFKDIKKGKKNK